MWMTAEETADRYRITVKGLQKQRAEGREPGSLGKRIGKRVLWASEELDRFDGAETFGADHATVLELQAATKLLRKISASLDTVVWYLTHEPIPSPEEEK